LLFYRKQINDERPTFTGVVDELLEILQEVPESKHSEATLSCLFIINSITNFHSTFVAVGFKNWRSWRYFRRSIELQIVIQDGILIDYIFIVLTYFARFKTRIIYRLIV